jgi:hypothetical protein
MSVSVSGRHASLTAKSVSLVDGSRTPFVWSASSVPARLRFAACDDVESSAAGGLAVPFIARAGMVLARPANAVSRARRGEALLEGVRWTATRRSCDEEGGIAKCRQGQAGQAGQAVADGDAHNGRRVKRWWTACSAHLLSRCADGGGGRGFSLGVKDWAGSSSLEGNTNSVNTAASHPLQALNFRATEKKESICGSS